VVSVSDVDYEQILHSGVYDEGSAPVGALERWSEFRDATASAVEYLIEPLIPVASMGFEGAGKGGGKTWVGLAAAICTATGKPFLGRFVVPTPRSVVYIALEGQRANIRDRIGALARGMGIDPDSDELDLLHFKYKPNPIDLRNTELTKRLVDEVMSCEPGLAIFDVLRRAALVRESADGVGDFAEVLRNLDGLGRAGCASLFEHHFTKPNDTTKQRDPGDRMSGSGSLFGHADFGIFITSIDRHTRTMTVSLYNRDDAELPELTVRLVGEGSGRYGGFTYQDSCALASESDQDPQDERAEHQDDAILRYLKANGGSNQTAIEKAVGGNALAVRGRINSLTTSGAIVATRGSHGAKLHWLENDPKRPRPNYPDGDGRGGVGASPSTASLPLRGRGQGAPRPDTPDGVGRGELSLVDEEDSGIDVRSPE
jgi:AAA domain